MQPGDSSALFDNNENLCISSTAWKVQENCSKIVQGFRHEQAFGSKPFDTDGHSRLSWFSKLEDSKAPVALPRRRLLRSCNPAFMHDSSTMSVYMFDANDESNRARSISERLLLSRSQGGGTK
ncbi:hypothetical protein B0H12DRAFT_1084417 [Mycena haematopus]|nr:hypothetical protein B0H12DRAFT_1084417 [Mycena haematopus]